MVVVLLFKLLGQFGQLQWDLLLAKSLPLPLRVMHLDLSTGNPDQQARVIKLKGMLANKMLLETRPTATGAYGDRSTS